MYFANQMNRYPSSYGGQGYASELDRNIANYGKR